MLKLAHSTFIEYHHSRQSRYLPSLFVLILLVKIFPGLCFFHSLPQTCFSYYGQYSSWRQHAKTHTSKAETSGSR